MIAMRLERHGEPLQPIELGKLKPEGHDLLIEINACGVCRTDFHIADGDLHPMLPIVPGHEVVGHVVTLGSLASGFRIGQRVGVPWLGRSCGQCPYCLMDRENLCDAPAFTGFHRNGGYASHCLADSRFCLAIPDRYTNVEAAPLLCAGLIGYRSLSAQEAAGAWVSMDSARRHTSWHRSQSSKIGTYSLSRAPETRKGRNSRARWVAFGRADRTKRRPRSWTPPSFSRRSGNSPLALTHVRKGGRVVCAGIHMSDIPSFPYADLWQERAIMSVANLTREDGREFMELAAEVPIRTHTRMYQLSEANAALDSLRKGEIQGAAVLVP
jgi:propanol-preferring alcohol dehydrogenase